MKLSIIVAMDRNRLIGNNNQLPWHLPADLQFFKKTTLGKPILMGRKTHESIGRPLPGRRNIIISRNLDYQANGCDVVHSIEAALELVHECEEAMLIGGATLYQQALPLAQRLYLTLVEAECEGDCWFPDYQQHEKWQEISRETHHADEKNQFNYNFVILDKNSQRS
ncbi:MAG: type 3 dihydrofolate reductase [Gammaproteobacteria bacterium]|nr:type 3 dihydrofolate reductase [Gammaproteobacteria bacterium]